MLRIAGMLMAMSLALFMASCGTGSTTEQESTATKVVSTTDHVMMPQNTAIAVTLIDSIDTDVQLSGAEFRAKLAEPIVVNGKTLFANNAEAKGVLDKIVESGGLQNAGRTQLQTDRYKGRQGSMGRYRHEHDRGEERVAYRSRSRHDRRWSHCRGHYRQDHQ